MSATEVNRWIGYLHTLIIRLESAGVVPTAIMLPVGFDGKHEVLPFRYKTLLGYYVIWSEDVDEPHVLLRPGPP